MRRLNLDFDSNGTRCAAWWYMPNGETRRPVVVMAHGMGATRELGLDPFARRFCKAGLCVFAFDYRHYGASDGEPRELLSIARQRDDYRAAIRFAREQAEADPTRVALWGSSFSGGHVIALAAEDLGLSAVVAQVPFTSGWAAARAIPVSAALRMNARALRDVLAQALGRPPVYLPLLGSHAALALMPGEEHDEAYRRLVPREAEESGRWRNRAAARIVFSVPFYEPGTYMKKAKVPILLILAEGDTLTPVAHALRAAEGCRMVEVRKYAGGHFDFYEGPGFERSVADQIAFLRKHLLHGQATRASDTAACF